MHSDLALIKLGIDTGHLPGDAVDRHIDDYLVMCFGTPFFCSTSSGIAQGDAGDCIISEPGFRQLHGSLENEAEGFRNDWIHIPPANGKRILARYGLPTNTILRIGMPGMITPYLRAIRRERLGDYPYGGRAVEHQLDGMFLQIARQYELSSKARMSPADRELHESLMNTRLKMREYPGRDWSLAELAEASNLSVSYFSSLYRKYFGVSPIDDLIDTRIEHAKMRLTQTRATLSQIATLCGFSSVYYFNRAFKQRVGVPPGRYRASMATQRP